MRWFGVNLNLDHVLPSCDHVQYIRTQPSGCVDLGSLLVLVSVTMDVFAWEAVCGYLDSCNELPECLDG